MADLFIDTVSVLEHRLDFLDGVSELATQCNWSPKQVEELRDYLLDEIIKIDNLMFDTFEATEDAKIAYVLWENHMEDLRHWLELVLGIKIKYI